jgi:CDP-glycerol glycerophosphotransferase
MLKKVLVKSVMFLCQIFSNKEQKIVYHSFPDFSDNSFATFIFVSEHFKTYKNVWLVDNYASKEKYLKLTSNYTKSNHLSIVKKKSFLGFFHYFTAIIVFHTHGLYNFLGIIPNQNKFNLWHGMPIKTIGYLDDPNNKNVPFSNYHTATSTFYQEILAKAFNVSEEKILINGQTRNDFLLEDKFSIHLLFNDENEYKKTLLWMPTFRKSVVVDHRIDGEIDGDIDFFNEPSLNRINGLLEKNNSICFVKLHPMDYRKIDDFKNYSNIRFIDNSSFEDKGINMYSTFKSVDILLTDFSSI